MQREKLPREFDLRPYFRTLEDLALDFGEPPLDWGRVFGNRNPVELEVGTGRGLFLLNAGVAHPAVNYVGIEIDYKEARYAARRMQKRELPNVRIVGGSVFDIVPKWMASGSLQAVHIYFPDPWWKRRHRSRRVFNPVFVEEAARLLPAGGRLHAWTDVEEYFGVMQETVAGNAAFTALPTPAERPAEHDLDYLTNFERKKRQAGLPIYRAEWRRV